MPHRLSATFALIAALSATNAGAQDAPLMTVVIKPGEQAPLSVLRLVELVNQVLPPGVGGRRGTAIDPPPLPGCENRGPRTALPYLSAFFSLLSSGDGSG